MSIGPLVNVLGLHGGGLRVERLDDLDLTKQLERRATLLPETLHRGRTSRGPLFGTSGKIKK